MLLIMMVGTLSDWTRQKTKPNIQIKRLSSLPLCNYGKLSPEVFDLILYLLLFMYLWKLSVSYEHFSFIFLRVFFRRLKASLIYIYISILSTSWECWSRNKFWSLIKQNSRCYFRTDQGDGKSICEKFWENRWCEDGVQCPDHIQEMFSLS